MQHTSNELTSSLVLNSIKQLSRCIERCRKFMVMSVYTVSLSTAGLNDVKNKWRRMFGSAKISCERRKRWNCAWTHKRRAEIFVALDGNGIKYVQRFNSSHFNGTKMIGYTIDWYNYEINKYVAFRFRRAWWTYNWGWNLNISKLSRH